MKNRNTIVLAVVAFAVIAGFSIYALNKNDGVDMNNMPMPSHSQLSSHTDKSSTEYKQYSTLMGEEYDRVFMANMIAHHQGAIDMANVASKNAKHQELKTLATAIVTAQTSEIKSMTAWQTSWGYQATSGSAMMEHGAMDMEHANTEMMSTLNDKTGDAFDMAFLSQMIMHHQGAIDMAVSGKTNAKHQEVRDLTVSIVTSQSKELSLMKQWQKDWGYTK